MGKEPTRPSRATRRFDATELASQTRKAKVTGTTPPATRRALRPTTPAISLPRTKTLEDPMTTQLLAEVARRSEIVELDDEGIDEAVERIGKAATTPTAHPRTVRRKT